jgi:hypothetical protein
MICSQCGNTVPEGAVSCQACGAPTGGYAAQTQTAGGYAGQTQMAGQPPGPPPYGGPPGPAQGPGPAQAYAFDVARWSQAERITGIATVVLLISLFLPWFTVSVSTAGFGNLVKGGTVSASGSGTDAHGYLWLVFVLGLAIVAFLVLRAGFSQLPFQLPLGPDMLLLIATGINLVLVLVAFFFKPGGSDLLGTGVSVSWAWGAFVGLVAAIAACVPLAIPAFRGGAAR